MGWTRPFVDLIMNFSTCGLNNIDSSSWDELIHLDLTMNPFTYGLDNIDLSPWDGLVHLWI